MSDIQVSPIDDAVLAGFAQRFQQVFGCLVTWTTATDKMQVIQKLFNGKEVTYPYACLTLTAMAANHESYNHNALARRGVRVTVGSNQTTIATAKLVPTNFEVEAEFITNKFQGVESGTVRGFARRWLLARRMGYLKYNVRYGSLSAGIGVTLSENVSIPVRENVVETETAYKTTVTATIHGYISEPILGSQGVTQEVIIDGQVVGADGKVPGYQFFAFPIKESST